MKSVIDNDQDLCYFCLKLLNSKPKFIAVDTEFMSNKKYNIFPKLCLIQIWYCGNGAAIDILSKNINDLSILEAVFANKDIIKVFHDFKQDILALLTKFANVPSPIIDTQFMAMISKNYYNNISYSNLVLSLLNINLAKKETRTNWSLRPLSHKQIEYALHDVSCLHDIYEILHNRLQNLGRLNWVKEDMCALLKELSLPYNTKNDTAYLFRKLLCKLRNTKKLLNEISDATIYRLSYMKKWDRKLLEKFLYHDDVNFLFEKIKSYKEKNTNFNYKKNNLAYLANLFLQHYCVQNDISYQAISSCAEINRLINANYINIRLLCGWRYSEIGNRLLQVLYGKKELKIKVKGEKLELNELVIQE